MFRKVHLEWTAWILGSLCPTHHRLLHLLCLIAARIKVWWLLTCLNFYRDSIFFFHKILIFEQVDVFVYITATGLNIRGSSLWFITYLLCVSLAPWRSLYIWSLLYFMFHFFVYGYCSVLFCISLFLLCFTHLFIFFSNTNTASLFYVLNHRYWYNVNKRYYSSLLVNP